MVMECGDEAASAEQMQVFVSGLQEFKNLTYRVTSGVAAIHFVGGMCYVVIYRRHISLDGSPPTNEATDVFLITPADLLRSARHATDFVLSLARAKLLNAFDLMSRLVH